jgi:hypothetical protein
MDVHQPLENCIFGRRRKKTRATGLTPYAMIHAAGFRTDVISGYSFLSSIISSP